MKQNKLGSNKVEELVYVHSNLRLLSHKRDEYKFGAAKLWDVEPESSNLDMMLNAKSHMTLFDAESPLGGSSSGHRSYAPTSREDVELLSDRNEDIFDDM